MLSARSTLTLLPLLERWVHELHDQNVEVYVYSLLCRLLRSWLWGWKWVLRTTDLPCLSCVADRWRSLMIAPFLPMSWASLKGTKVCTPTLDTCMDLWSMYMYAYTVYMIQKCVPCNRSRQSMWWGISHTLLNRFYHLLHYDSLNHSTTVHVCRYYKEDLAKMKPGQPMPERWKLFFKFFCYLRPHNVPSDSIESVFLYEQVRMTHYLLSFSTLLLSKL